ncbi:DHA3 family macrolide efflux protein-like MFS transporter [Anaerobacterium chartisolvens]|uniref:DHA3 family macrolide efflux protein-like MFS transporter n=1 Tax=Anaerobacterium chartisolvens TaxID=1297424 RepID=A0A369AY19_9FIRM|nr:MFS transporter [Anaerobacterium chartisolvens]RCX14312.1 DHA3 family macrolide efflux protein-like MFS transporter [Anaerobacterium chartisolvens]
MNNNWKRNIVLFLASQTISLFGTSLVQYAIAWYITLKTQSGVMMMISIICGFIPTFVLSPFAGVWADRYNRKLLIALSDSMIALATLVLAIMLFMGHDAIWLFFVMSAIRAVGTGIQTPAVGAFIPQLVPEDKLMRVNAVNGSIQSLVLLASPMLSGALMSMASIESIFFIDVITATVAVSVLLLFLHVPVHAKASEKQPISYFSDMRKGFNYIKSHEYVRRFFLYCAVFFVMAAPVAFLTPLQVSRSFGNDVWRLTAVEIVFSVGMMAGGIFMASWGGFKNKVYTMALSNLVTGACTVALGIVPVFWIYLLFMGLIGVVMPVFNTPSMVLLQQKVEEEYLGRVFGVLTMISSAMMPLGMLVFGPIADFVKIEWLLIATGLMLFAEGVFMMRDKVLVAAGK